MPGQGRVVERPFTPEERSAMAGCFMVHSLHLATPPWMSISMTMPSGATCPSLASATSWEEVLHFAEVGRRIGGILGLTLDANAELELS